ncbi:MAG: hypothetical protein IT303_05420 [Dehalococcoidia bacterium]|nr:hypothetical protein [Dehalococcoidia bacterium]
MRTRFFRTMILLVLVAGAAAASAREATRADGGIGVYPTQVVFDDALRGGQYFSTLGVINNLEGERTFAFEAEGDIAPWVSFTDVDDRTMPVTEVTAPRGRDGYVLLRLSVPDSASNGVYRGTVTTTVPLGGEGSDEDESGSAVTVAAVIDVEARVTGVQKIDGSLLDVAVTDVEVGVPLRVRSVVANRSNVRVVPDVQVAILNGTTTVATAATVDAPIDPDETRTIETQWPTDAAPPGDYSVKVSATLPGMQLGERTMRFRVLPRGTLTRSGAFENLELVNDPTAGGVAKIIATFRNTGEIESTAVFAGELYRDGVLVKPIVSLQKLVRKDEAQELEALVEVPGTGTYVLRGKVNYEGKETEVRELLFTIAPEVVEGRGSPSGVVWGFAGGAAALVVVAAASSGWFVVRRKRQPVNTGGR